MNSPEDAANAAIWIKNFAGLRRNLSMKEVSGKIFLRREWNERK